jgi:hypothetical protein
MPHGSIGLEDRIGLRQSREVEPCHQLLTNRLARGEEGFQRRNRSHVAILLVAELDVELALLRSGQVPGVHSPAHIPRSRLRNAEDERLRLDRIVMRQVSS